MNKYPYWIEPNTRDKLETLHQEADNYRLLQLTYNNSSKGCSNFFQNIRTFFKCLDLFQRNKSKASKGVKSM